MAKPARAGVRGFSDGMVSDVARHLIPDSALWNAEDVLFDEQGAIRRRGGVKLVAETFLAKGISSDSRSYYRSCMYIRSEIGDGFECLWLMEDNQASIKVNQLVPGNTIINMDGVDKLLVNGPKTIGRPFEYWNCGIQPVYAEQNWGGGAYQLLQSTLMQGDGTVALGTPATCVLTAANANIPVAAADKVLLRVGRLMQFSGATESFITRIVDIDWVNNRITVSPTPPVTFTSITATLISDTNNALIAGTQGCLCGCSFSGRILLGGIADRSPTTLAISPRPNRIMWSLLPDDINLVSAVNYRGMNFASSTGFNAYMSVDVPDIARIVGMEPQGDNSVYLFGEDAVYVINGSLPTLTGSRGSITFDISRVTNQVGCVNDHTIRNTRHGIVFADAEGIYIMGDTGPQNLLSKKVEKLYRSMVEEDGTNVLGGAYLGEDHYVLSTVNGSLLVDIKDGKWSKMKNIKFYSSFRDKKNDRVYATHNDFISRIDSLLNENTIRDEYPFPAAPVEPVIETKAFDLGTSSLKQFKRAKFDYSMRSAKQEKKSIIGFNTDMTELMNLPNSSAEFANTKWWRPTGATLSTLALGSDVFDALYTINTISVTTTVANSGVQYDLPAVGTKIAGGHRLYTEVWVKSGGTPTITVTVFTHGTSGPGVTTTNAVTLVANTWTRIPVTHSITTADSNRKNYIKIESGTAVTFAVYRLRCMFGHPWNDVFAAANAITLDSTLGNAAPGRTFSLKCVTTTANAGMGVGISLFNFIPKPNRTYRVRFRVKSSAATQALTLYVGGYVQNTTLPIVATNDGFADFDITWTPGAFGSTSIYFFDAQVKTSTAVAVTFWVQDIQIWEEDPVLMFAGIGGVDGKGDFGDSFSREDWEASTVTAAKWDQGTGQTASQWALANGQLSVDGTALNTQLQLIKTKDIKKFKSGRHRAKVRINKDNDTTFSHTIGLRHLSGVSQLGLRANQANIFIVKRGASDFTETTLGAGITSVALSTTPLEGGQPVWLELEAVDRLLNARYYNEDPDIISNLPVANEGHYLSAVDFAAYDVNGYGYINWLENETDGYIEWNEIEPYDNLGSVDPLTSRDQTSYVGHMYVISEALTLKVRSFGDALLRLRGVTIEAEILNEFRTD